MNDKTKGFKIDMRRLLAPAALVVLFIFFSIFGNKFLTTAKMITILESTYFNAFLAFGITFVIITGGIDLSIGTNLIMSALIGAFLYSKGLNIWLSIFAVVLVAVIIGTVNGILIAYLELPPFIATLGMMMVTQGLGSTITKVQTQNWPARATEPLYRSIFYKTTTSGFPSGIIYMGIFFLIAAFLLSKTILGRYNYAIGSNAEAVRLSGVNVARWKAMIYAICGMFAGLGAIVYACTFTTIIPGTGNGYEMNAIAAVIIGGTSMSGGTGSMSGTLIGAFLLSVLNAGLLSMNVPGHTQSLVTGIVVILAVLFDIYRNKNRAKKFVLEVETLLNIGMNLTIRRK